MSRFIGMDQRVKEALAIIQAYGTIGGDHHRAWVLDQVVRTLAGCPSVSKEFVDNRGNKFKAMVLGENREYLDWVATMEEWDAGIAP